MSLANKSSSVLLRDIFLLFSTLFSSIVIARTLGPEIMGVWVALNIIPSYAEMFGRTRVDISAIYFLAKGKYVISEVTHALNLIAVFTSIIILAIIFFFFDYLSLSLLKDKKDAYLLSMIIILAAIPLNLIYLNYMYLHTFNEDAKSMSYMILTRALSMVVIVIPGLIYFNFDVMQLVICFVLSYLLGFFIGFLRFQHHKRKGPFINLLLIKNLFLYSYKMYISGLLINLNQYIANTFILMYGSLTQITFFALAQQFSQMLYKIIDSMNTFVFPSASKKDSSESKFFIAKAFRTASVIMLPVSILSAILIYPAIYIFYGNNFLPVVQPFLILLLGVTFSSITGTILMYFMSTGKPEIITKTLILPVIIQLLIAPYLISSFDILGAAVALSAGMILGGFVQTVTFIHIANISFTKNLVPTKNDVLTVVDFTKSIFRKSN